MEETVLALALELAGLKEGEAPGLSLSCRLAVVELTGLLRSNVAPEDCWDAFSAAAAKLALADWAALHEMGRTKKFTAGDITVEEGAGDPQALRRQALRLMAPYLSDPGIHLQGVRT